MSRTIEPILDVEDFIEPAYDLEVCSPVSTARSGSRPTSTATPASGRT